jgi:hypothetical protein
MKPLELKDIAGYLPYDLKYCCEYYSGRVEIHSYNEYKYVQHLVDNLDKDMPILRPLSDLYKTIIHNGKQLIPIVECAKIHEKDEEWGLNENKDRVFSDAMYYEFGYSKGYGKRSNVFFARSGRGRAVEDVYEQYKLFDCFNSLKIDYRGLIDDGLAIDCNTLEINPYK